MYRHSGPLSEGQRRGETRCTDTQDFCLEIKGRVGITVCRHSGTLYKDERRGGIICTDTQDFHPKVRGELRPQCRDTQDLNL